MDIYLDDQKLGSFFEELKEPHVFLCELPVRAEREARLLALVFCHVLRGPGVLPLEGDSGLFSLADILSRRRRNRAGDRAPGKEVVLSLEVGIDIQVP